jgi:hypothetical protein
MGEGGATRVVSQDKGGTRYINGRGVGLHMFTVVNNEAVKLI